LAGHARAVTMASSLPYLDYPHASTDRSMNNEVVEFVLADAAGECLQTVPRGRGPVVRIVGPNSAGGLCATRSV
jgi:hypothetical protein